MVSQSMAREYGPRGIHVAHVVVDGGINGERLRANSQIVLLRRARPACYRWRASPMLSGSYIASRLRGGLRR